ncbi:hypothetical protein BDV26DRAFT_299170 [Aspergillus bertholletiae]|uniref:Nucleoside phosphorylase domain-containing protein n=1 Tax=Aspergillus bertholletiae TaxID=1226010 RepID=A0A5N7AM90_9EURO|nr:hypothetical protein BDV26DRAFT_299170 [Aspergillus bertholletiae]
MSAARYMLDEEHDRLSAARGDTNQYIFGEISGHNIAIASLPTGYQGIASAATVASHMARTFPSITLRILVGIGGGVPSEKADIRLGDVVVSVPDGTQGGVIEYDLGKQTSTGFQRKGFLCPPPTEWLTVLSVMKSDHRIRRNHVSRFITGMIDRFPRLVEYIRPETDVLYQSDYHHSPEWSTCENCNADREVVRCARESPDEPVIHYGLIASGNRVMKDGVERDTISKDSGGAICFEMEAAGLMNDFRCIVIRGISDYADSHKNDIWQPYAAAAATGVAKEMLSYIDPPFGCSDGDLLIEIANWLSPLNFLQTQRDILDRRSDGTGQWLLNCDKFQSWLKGTKKTLWCHGIPGCGKTVLAAAVVDHVSYNYQDDSVATACVFCSYQDRLQLTPSNIFASLLKQLIMHEEEPLPLSREMKELYISHSKKGTRPRFDEYLGVLQCEAHRFKKVFIVIDALDELSVDEETLVWLLRALESLELNTNLMFTSRTYTSVTIESMKRDVTIMEVQANDQDVRAYLEQRITTIPRLNKFVQGKKALQRDFIDTIAGHCKGMFLLARLHVELLATKHSRNQVRRALKELPESLDEVYGETMRRIENQDSGTKQLATCVLDWVCYAVRPLTLEELQHAIAVVVGTRMLHEDDLVDGDLLISICSGFISLDRRSGSVRFVHGTVREYLEKSRVDRLRQTQILLTNACLTYLLFDEFSSGPCSDDDELVSRLSLYPFYLYAAKHWGDHASVSGEEDSQKIILEFCRCDSNLSSAVQAMSVCGYRHGSSLLPADAPALCIVAYFGLEHTVEWLLSGGADATAQTSDGNTALHMAARRGHPEAVQALLHAGAHCATANNAEKTAVEEAWLGFHEAALHLLEDEKANLSTLLPAFERALHAVSRFWNWSATATSIADRKNRETLPLHAASIFISVFGSHNARLMFLVTFGCLRLLSNLELSHSLEEQKQSLQIKFNNTDLETISNRFSVVLLLLRNSQTRAIYQKTIVKGLAVSALLLGLVYTYPEIVELRRPLDLRSVGIIAFILFGSKTPALPNLTCSGVFRFQEKITLFRWNKKLDRRGFQMFQRIQSLSETFVNLTRLLSGLAVAALASNEFHPANSGFVGVSEGFLFSSSITAMISTAAAKVLLFQIKLDDEAPGVTDFY